jgi:hypothetical protein
MNETSDRLYELLPVVYRQRDAEQGWPLKALLRVIGEQVGVVETDIAQLYENWFIETCEDWVVPYIGDLVGYRIVYEAGEPAEPSSPQGRLRNRILIPRREVANTVRYRRRKGTLALLELLANHVAGWPARAVEFYRLVGCHQAVNHLRPQRGRTVDVRLGDALERLDGPFDELAHTVDVRRIDSHRTPGRYNLPNVGVFVWRLKSFSVTQAPAYCMEPVGDHCYTFSVLGNDVPLYTRPQREAEPTDIAGELNLPIPIRRRALEQRLTDYYGETKSFHIWLEVETPSGSGESGEVLDRVAVPPEKIIVADLTDWQYHPISDRIALDPELGRISFSPRALPKGGVWVSYRYGFSTGMGGGDYARSSIQQENAKRYAVGENQEHKTLTEALRKWQEDSETDENSPPNAVIEITDSGAYVEHLKVVIPENRSLQIRAANGVRPTLRLLDWHTSRLDDLRITGEAGSRFSIDGLLITGRGLHVEGAVAAVAIRHCTLVPGWGFLCEPESARAVEPSLELVNTGACVTIDHSIIGPIQAIQDEVQADPIKLHINDSIIDATSREREVLGAPGGLFAHADVTIVRSTVFGRIETHVIELAENSIFLGPIRVVRRQRGCMRFCYVMPHSRTPRRYYCQPDLVEKPIKDRFDPDTCSAEDRDREINRERLRVRPVLNSTRYGDPAYCQLADDCADEIKRGADDRSEMGAFHDLYSPQREANLRARLNEYTPAGMDVGIITAS